MPDAQLIITRTKIRSSGSPYYESSALPTPLGENSHHSHYHDFAEKSMISLGSKTKLYFSS